MRLLFSVLIFGVASFPAWRMTQPAREESNSLVKRRGRGVDVNSRVGVGAGVLVAGIRVGVEVTVGKSGATGVDVAGWQAVISRTNPMRSFFMALIKTYLSRALFQIISSLIMNYPARFVKQTLLDN